MLDEIAKWQEKIRYYCYYQKLQTIVQQNHPNSMSQKIKLEVNHQAHAANTNTKDNNKSGTKLQSPKKQSKTVEVKKQSKTIEVKKQLTTIPEQSKQKNAKDQPIQDKNTNNKNNVNKEPEKPNKNSKTQDKKPNNQEPSKDPKNGKKIIPQIKIPEKKDVQLETINKIKNEQNKAKLTIQQLIEQYKGTSDDIFTNHGHNPEKEKSIAARIQRLQKEKRQRLLKIQIENEKQKRRKEKEQQEQYNKQLNKINKIKNKIKKRCEKTIQQTKANAQSRIQKQAQFQEFYDQFKEKKPLYAIIALKEQRKQQQLKQQYEQKLKRNHEQYKPMKIEEIKQFEEKYMEKKYERSIEVQNKKQFQLNNLAIQNKKIQKLWRGEFHKITQQEQLQQKLKKQEAKKILQSRINYGTKVKLNHKPQTKSSNNPFIAETIQEQPGIEKKVIVEKYKHGVNLGPAIQMRRLSLSVQEKNQIGNSYLEQIKKKPKKPHQVIDRYDQTIQEHSLEMETKKREKKINQKQQVEKMDRQINPYYRYSPLSNRTQINNKDSLIYEMTKIDGKKNLIQLQEKSIKYGNYNGILELQKKKNSLSKNIIQNITQKLDLLQKL